MHPSIEKAQQQAKTEREERDLLFRTTPFESKEAEVSWTNEMHWHQHKVKQIKAKIKYNKNNQ